jgi:hypothetical protein
VEQLTARNNKLLRTARDAAREIANAPIYEWRSSLPEIQN